MLQPSIAPMRIVCSQAPVRLSIVTAATSTACALLLALKLFHLPSSGRLSLLKLLHALDLLLTSLARNIVSPSLLNELI